jgi:hypothetical protein
VEFLSEDWIARLAALGAELPTVDGATVTCQHEIAGAPSGKVRFFTVWENGVLTEAAIGKHTEPTCMVQAKAPDALDVLHGRKEPEVAFMQGRLKVDGAYRQLLVDLREWRASDAYRSIWSTMAAETD